MNLHEEILEEFKKEFNHSQFCKKNTGNCVCDYSNIKSFFFSALKRYGEAMVREIEGITSNERLTFMEDKGMISEKVDYKKEEGYKIGYNQALIDIQQSLRSKFIEPLDGTYSILYREHTQNEIQEASGSGGVQRPDYSIFPP